MNVLVFLIVLAALAALGWVDAKVRRFNILAWLAAWWVAVYVVVSYGIEPPLPSSIVGMFMAIVTLALAAYVTADGERMAAARDVTVAFMTERRFTVPLVLTVVALPLLAAWQVYRDVTAAPQPPVSGRTIHPPPPATIQYQGATMDLAAAENPYRALERTDPAAYAEHVANGRRVYFQNCHFCHGDNMQGRGQFAHGFDPIPANFVDPTTIAMLQESYLFWRIAKGGPGLPDESTPWLSAMPAWEDLLTEEEIWDVILFLYEYTGHRPRAKEEVH